jgi:hypothetical protein
LDKTVVEISDRFLQLQELDSRFGFLCNAEPLVNHLDVQNHEQFIELRNKCTHLAQQYSKDVNGFELYQDYKDIIIFLKRAKRMGKTGLFFRGTAQMHFINGIGGT